MINIQALINDIKKYLTPADKNKLFVEHIKNRLEKTLLFYNNELDNITDHLIDNNNDFKLFKCIIK